MSRRRKLLFHVESLWGIGHVVRGLRLLEALSKHFECSVASGTGAWCSLEVERFAAWHQLSSIHYGPDCDYLLADDFDEHQVALRVRLDEVVRAFLTVQPDVLLVEMFPFGRHVLLPEMLMLFELAYERSVPIVVSLRDICIYPTASSLRNKYALVIGEVLRSFSPHVLIHSDPAFQTIEDAVPSDLYANQDLALSQTGFIGRPLATERPGPDTIIWCSVGGGRRGNELLSRGAGLLRRTGSCVATRFILGLHTPSEIRAQLDRELTGANFTLEGFSGARILEPLNGVAGLLVAGGYNSWMDILATRVPTLVVPLDEEQELRTRRLTQLCPWVRSVSLQDDDETWDSAWLESVAAPKVMNGFADTGGAKRTAEIISARLP